MHSAKKNPVAIGLVMKGQGILSRWYTMGLSKYIEIIRGNSVIAGCIVHQEGA